MFENVALRAADGELVTWATIPRFTPRMDVLQWGRRLFVRRGDGDYYEGAFFVVLPGWEAAAKDVPAPASAGGDQEEERSRPHG